MSLTQAYESGGLRKSGSNSPMPLVMPAIALILYCCFAVAALQHPPVNDAENASATSTTFIAP